MYVVRVRTTNRNDRFTSFSPFLVSRRCPFKWTNRISTIIVLSNKLIVVYTLQTQFILLRVIDLVLFIFTVGIHTNDFQKAIMIYISQGFSNIFRKIFIWKHFYLQYTYYWPNVSLNKSLSYTTISTNYISNVYSCINRTTFHKLIMRNFFPVID